MANSTPIAKYIELCANAASLVVVVIILGVLVQQYIVAPHQDDTIGIKPGARFSLPGVRWEEAHSTLVFALSVHCRYCSASVPFYRRLLSANANTRYRTIALFPEGEKESREYLQWQQLPIANVIQVSLTSINVRETPTVILVGEAGRVESVWKGQLTRDGEQDVVSRLGLDDRADELPTPKGDRGMVAVEDLIEPSLLISGAELARMDKSTAKRQPIVDIRDREYYVAGHIAIAVNIPFDELNSRALHELPRDRMVVVYCHYRSSCENKQYREGLQTFCSLGHHILMQLGFRNIKFVSDDLYELQRSGVRVTTTAGTDRVAMMQ